MNPLQVPHQGPYGMTDITQSGYTALLHQWNHILRDKIFNQFYRSKLHCILFLFAEQV